MFWNYQCNKEYKRTLESQKTQIETTQDKINELEKKYQDKPDTLIRDYDDLIKDVLIGIIANFTLCKL